QHLVPQTCALRLVIEERDVDRPVRSDERRREPRVVLIAARRGPRQALTLTQPARATYLVARGPRCADVTRAYEEHRRLRLEVLSVLLSCLGDVIAPAIHACSA